MERASLRLADCARRAELFGWRRDHVIECGVDLAGLEGCLRSLESSKCRKVLLGGHPALFRQVAVLDGEVAVPCTRNPL